MNSDREGKNDLNAESVDKKREIHGLFYLAAALFLAIIFYVPAGRTGLLGEAVRSVGAGLFGTAALALPVLFVYMSLDYFLAKELQRIRQRFTAVLLSWLNGSVMIALIGSNLNQLATLAEDETATARATLALRQLWDWGSNSLSSAEGIRWSGGLVGGLLAQGLRSVIGQTGALIFSAAMLLALFVLIFNLSYSRAIHKTATKISRTQSKVQSSVRQRMDDLRYHRDMRTNAPQVRRVDNTGFDLPLPTSYPSVQKEKRKGIYRPDEPGDENFSDQNEPLPTGEDTCFDANDLTRSMPELDGSLELPDDSVIGPVNDEASGVEIPVMAGQSINPKTSESSADTIGGFRQLELDGLPTPIKYIAPSLALLNDDRRTRKVQMHTGDIRALGRKLEDTLASFKVDAKVVNFTTGPTITRFELTPGPGVKVSRIVNLADDIALNLAAMGVRIEAPIPGKAAIGIEIPNKETVPVLLRGLLESAEFQEAKSPLTAALGRDVQGKPIYCDLATMPHLLIAGATGSGKSVCINCILMSLLYKAKPEQLRLLMIDPKVVELNVYNGIPHLIQPVVTDPKKAFGVLSWAVNEMTRRYALFADRSVRDIHSYNAALELDLEDDSSKLPLILLVIDELSDLMATTPNEVEDAIARLTAMARAAGIHLIIATQRPSVDVITGVIKANIPSRIAFAVASHIDSRTILDMGGAEKLLGRGDMLYYPQNASKPVRGQGAFISDAEVEKVLFSIKSKNSANYDEEVAEAIRSVPITRGKEKDKDRESPGDQDELLPQALGIVVETGYASVSLLQRRMTIGYPRAARLIDRLHEMGHIGPFEGSKPRKVLLSMAQYMDMQSQEDTK